MTTDDLLFTLREYYDLCHSGKEKPTGGNMLSILDYIIPHIEELQKTHKIDPFEHKYLINECKRLQTRCESLQKSLDREQTYIKRSMKLIFGSQGFWEFLALAITGILGVMVITLILKLA